MLSLRFDPFFDTTVGLQWRRVFTRIILNYEWFNLNVIKILKLSSFSIWTVLIFSIDKNFPREEMTIRPLDQSLQSPGLHFLLVSCNYCKYFWNIFCYIPSVSSDDFIIEELFSFSSIWRGTIFLIWSNFSSHVWEFSKVHSHGLGTCMFMTVMKQLQTNFTCIERLF